MISTEEESISSLALARGLVLAELEPAVAVEVGPESVVELAVQAVTDNNLVVAADIVAVAVASVDNN